MLTRKRFRECPGCGGFFDEEAFPRHGALDGGQCQASEGNLEVADAAVVGTRKDSNSDQGTQPSTAQIHRQVRWESLNGSSNLWTEASCVIGDSLAMRTSSAQDSGMRAWINGISWVLCDDRYDQGWGCGYRVMQMMLPFVHRTRNAPFSWTHVWELGRGLCGAWKSGWDPKAARHFLGDRNEDIGGDDDTKSDMDEYEDVYIEVGCEWDFPAFGLEGRHVGAADWLAYLAFVWKERALWWKAKPCCNPGGKIFTLLQRIGLHLESPLYWQIPGHALLIVGWEFRPIGSSVVYAFDPSARIEQIQESISNGDWSMLAYDERRIDEMMTEFEILQLDGPISHVESTEKKLPKW